MRTVSSFLLLFTLLQLLLNPIFSISDSDDPFPVRREVYGNGRIFDITHRITSDMPSYGSEEGLGQFLWLPNSMKNGSLANNSVMKLPTHTGTHIDAPGHVFDHYYDAGFDVDTLDLEVLNGPALLVDVPRDKNLTAEVMTSLHIPKGVKRVLFRTLNTDRRLMWKKKLDSSFVGFMKDGAQWLVDNTDIKLVGIDYLSIAAYDDLIPAHLVFLKSREIIVVEALKLDDIKPGIYTTFPTIRYIFQYSAQRSTRDMLEWNKAPHKGPNYERNAAYHFGKLRPGSCNVHKLNFLTCLSFHCYPLLYSSPMTNHNTSLFCPLLPLAAVLALVSVTSVAGVVSLSDLQKIMEEERNYMKKKVIDISHKYVPDLPAYGSNNGLGNFIKLETSIKLGDLSNYSVFKLATHSGTHVDAPRHFNQTLFESGYDVVSLHLPTLNGPVLVVDTPRDKNITADIMRSLNIPRGVKRVLFRTLNTDRRLMYRKEFDSSYAAFTSDGAEYLVQNTDIKLIGVDYLSDIIPVEGLNLDDAVPGVYGIHCLPLRLVHGDGSPTRCILFQ
ncbi:hypothetical protein RDI58_024698 [Solanum bulbocastanum]|uniref:Uncharacterized protein n=2 Tax=Solanum TaxID=4107 RepID=A0AAN8SY50_SOLBU